MKLSAAELRRELSQRNLLLAEAVPHECTYGAIPSVLYQEVEGEHGNFLRPSYRRICAAPDWHRRLKKCYSASRRLARSSDRIRRELDCASSSDALLMNIFCYPGLTCRKSVCALLGIAPGARPQFGFKPGIPLLNGRADRTEIDMVLGHLFVEAKLTEGDFQTGRADLLHRYKDLDGVFEVGELPSSGGTVRSYQLIRGVMAAHQLGMSFLVLYDGRRPDLAEACYRVIRAVRGCGLRSRLSVLTWQELSCTLPNALKTFLVAKYGIYASPITRDAVERSGSREPAQ